MERPREGRSLFLLSGPRPVRITPLSDNSRLTKCSVGILRGGVFFVGQVRYFSLEHSQEQAKKNYDAG